MVTGPSFPHHRVAADLIWPYWRWSVVRMAGFPYAPLERLTLHETVAVADRWDAAMDQAEAARKVAVAAFTETPFGDWGEEERRVLVTSARRISAGKPITENLDLAERCFSDAFAAYQEWRARDDEAKRAELDVANSYDRELHERRRSLRALIDDSAIREAMIWQSLSAYRAIEKLITDGLPQKRNKQVRRGEMLAAMYLQRFLAKNDTVGFFGPRAVAALGDQDAAVTFAANTLDLGRREVFFEHWAMVEIARAVAADPSVADWLRPRRPGQIAVNGRTLHYPVGQKRELAPNMARLLRLADGTRTIAELKRETIGSNDEQFASSAAFVTALDQLEEMQLLCRWPVVPTCETYVWAELRREIELFPESAARRKWLGRLDRIEDCRGAVECARGASAVERTLADLSDFFSEIAGTAAERKAGKVYGARHVVYMDCRSGHEIAIGSDFLERLKPLELVFETVRAYSARLWQTIDGPLRDQHAALDEDGDAAVDWIRFIDACLNDFLTVETCYEVVRDLQSVWRRALGVTGSETRIETSYEELRSRLVRELGDAPPAWPGARFHSPDLMVAAENLEAIACGNYQIVVGEIHGLRNMICYPVAMNMHPEMHDDVLAAHDADVPELLRPNVRREDMHRATNFLPPRSEAIRMIDVGWPPPKIDTERLFAEADLIVVKDDTTGALHVESRDGRLRTSLAVALNSYVGGLLSVAAFKILDGEHTPRLIVDDVVLARESWRLPGPPAAEGLEGFLSVRKWAAECGLPPRFFVKSPHEVKPFLVDLENPF